jgi:hypothetical protein
LHDTLRQCPCAGRIQRCGAQHVATFQLGKEGAPAPHRADSLLAVDCGGAYFFSSASKRESPRKGL